MMSRHSARRGSRLARRLPQPACRRPGTPPSLHADHGHRVGRRPGTPPSLHANHGHRRPGTPSSLHADHGRVGRRPGTPPSLHADPGRVGRRPGTPSSLHHADHGRVGRRPGTPPSLHHADPGRVAQLVGGIAGHVLRGRGQSVCVVERTDVSNVDADVVVRASGVVAVGVGLMDGKQRAGGVDHAHVVLYGQCDQIVVVGRAPHYHVTRAQPRELAGSDEEEIFGVGREQTAAPASRPRHILRHVQQRVVA